MVFTKPNVDAAICYKIIMRNQAQCVRLRIDKSVLSRKQHARIRKFIEKKNLEMKIKKKIIFIQFENKRKQTNM